MKGQVSAPFHWIYVLIAGGIILLFFVGIVIKQKAVSEKELSITVLNKLDGIFTGAALSEQTTNIIDIPELELSFVCDESGYAEYRVDGTAREIAVQPFFAPSFVETSRLVTWTLAFNMPFNVINFLFVGAPTITYLVVYDPLSPSLKEKLEQEVPAPFNFQYVAMAQFNDAIDIATPSVKLLFLNDPPATLPLPIRRLPDGQVRAVKLSDAAVTFYAKRGDGLAYQDAIALLHVFDDKNPALYGAVFSDDSVAYRCALGKAFRRMALLADIYQTRTERIVKSFPPTDVCALQADARLFGQIRDTAASCSPLSTDACGAVFSLGETVRQQNTNMQNSNCPALY